MTSFLGLPLSLENLETRISWGIQKQSGENLWNLSYRGNFFSVFLADANVIVLPVYEELQLQFV